ncbi:LOW QUALITY PROTEIN: hypothetical protein Cgig2_015395 [Carnegiea gigantea]|uniref:Uncharacterized protein n=1 Tax=Carnegiea gigantea TaxID=171969 RepID=A0A9Q1JTS3_9CARY|nr:LOW QUALITY PROTEIN: hypothetical protein Cgig2_015395 [Carnegiea gigantea]
MVDALKNLMSTMTDSITRQVSEQVKRVIKATNLARPLPHCDYIPTHGGELSHQPKWIPSPQVDFFVVDVSTAYNVILRRPTLHKGVTHRALHYPHNPPPQKPRPQHPGGWLPVPCALTLARRRDKLHVLRVTAFIFVPLMLVHIVEASNSCPPETLGLASPRPYLNIPCSLTWATLSAPTAVSASASAAASASAFASASSNWHCKLFFSASLAFRLAFNFSQHHWH